MTQDSSQERTEQPTEKRKKETKERGSIARSKDFNSMIVLLVGGVSFLIFGRAIFSTIRNIFYECFSFDARILQDPNAMVKVLREAFMSGLSVILPMLLLVFLFVILGTLLVGGWTFTLSAINVKFDRLDPIKGLSKIFSLKSVMELLKSIIKIVIILVSLWVVYYLYFNDIIRLSFLDYRNAIGQSLNILICAFFILCSGVVIVSMLDVPYQIWEHARQMKMTKQEIKDEYKDSEGKPEVKSKLNQMQRELSKRRMMAALPLADVIITNPTHYAVALKYDDNKMNAPTVVAKGADHMALRIIESGKKHAVVLVNMPPLARSIYYHTEIGQEIPSGLYMSVAQVLGYVYQLKQYRKGKLKKPKLPTKIDIPEELKK